MKFGSWLRRGHVWGGFTCRQPKRMIQSFPSHTLNIFCSRFPSSTLQSTFNASLSPFSCICSRTMFIHCYIVLWSYLTVGLVYHDYDYMYFTLGDASKRISLRIKYAPFYSSMKVVGMEYIKSPKYSSLSNGVSCLKSFLPF